jgi:hypothetical protein
MIRRLVTATLFTAIAAGPALAADFDFVDAKGFRHWNREGRSTAHQRAPNRPYHFRREAAVKPAAPPPVDHSALFREFLYGSTRPAVVVPKQHSEPPPAWAGTIEEAVKRWPHSAE